MSAARVIHPVGAVSIEDLFSYLRAHRRDWPVAKLAKLAKLPRSVVYRALEGENVTVKTLQRIAEVLGGRVLIVLQHR